MPDSERLTAWLWEVEGRYRCPVDPYRTTHEAMRDVPALLAIVEVLYARLCQSYATRAKGASTQYVRDCAARARMLLDAELAALMPEAKREGGDADAVA